MIYQDLLAALEKICVLVTITYFASRTEVFARLVSQASRPRDKLFTVLFFGSLALTETLLSSLSSPGDARVIAATAAGLLAGFGMGLGVGFAVALMNVLFLGSQAWTAGVPALVGGALGGWVYQYRSSFGPKVVAGYLAGALSHGLWLAMEFSQDWLLAPWDVLALQYVLPMMLSGAGLSLFLMIVNDMRVQRERIQEQAQMVAKAELKALQAQVDPHFLFNVLNTIAAMCELSPGRASELTVKLGDFFRESFRSERKLTSTLEEELSTVRTYLEIERARFGDRLRVVEEVEAEALQCTLPCFTLQPLVENAILHGLSKSAGERTLRISARRRNGRLVCWVVDNGRGFDSAAVGCERNEPHALPMLSKRLARIYDGGWGLRIRSRTGKGTVVCLWVPATQQQD